MHPLPKNKWKGYKIGKTNIKVVMVNLNRFKKFGIPWSVEWCAQSGNGLVVFLLCEIFQHEGFHLRNLTSVATVMLVARNVYARYFMYSVRNKISQGLVKHKSQVVPEELANQTV